jgi:alanine racemase
MAYITIDRDNLLHNLNLLALKTASKKRLAIVLKDNAYGHGDTIIARLASSYGIEEAVCATVEEAKRVEKFFRRILILRGEPFPHPIFSFAVNSLDDLARCAPDSSVELKFDTGMHRNGIPPDSLSTALEMVKRKSLDLVGIMSHYADADMCGSEFYRQRRVFREIRSIVSLRGIAGVRFHSHNSAALLRCSSFDEDIARVGIASYGLAQMPSPFGSFDLRPVLSLYAEKVSSIHLHAGARIGYGGEYRLEEDATLSTYDIGYGSGWRRGDASNPYITPHGLRILGRVSMDFITLRSTDETVCIMDDARVASKHFGTISYEIVTSLHPAIERRVVKGNVNA